MKELRIGLVLYGGVALAVYINGVVTEIWHALRASRAMQDNQDEKPDSTADVYKKLLEKLQESDDTEDLRIVVDAVAGTSAGGVNGAAIFKAIVEGADASILNKVWLDDADIENLKGKPDKAPFWIRAVDWSSWLSGKVRRFKKSLKKDTNLDWEWVRNTAYTVIMTDDGSKTPLKGNYFTQIIAKSLKDMSEGKTGPRLLPDRGTFDLFLTRTDLHGWPRHLPVSTTYHPTDLYERTHAHVMAFQVRPGDAGTGRPVKNDVSDFDLTFGARTTAGFPIAFAPTTYAQVLTNFLIGYKDGNAPPAEDFSERYLREHQLSEFPVERARMVDGGILDNRPFTHVTRAIEAKPADYEVRRVVAYIEPDPENKDPLSAHGIDLPPEKDPLPMELIPGLFRLFRHEPIHGDLRELQRRNNMVERFVAYRDANAPALDGYVAQIMGDDSAPVTAQQLDRWRQSANSKLAADPLSGYQGYVALKLRRAADIYAEIVSRALNTPYDSRQAFSVRKIIRAWMQNRPLDDGTTTEDVLDPLNGGPGGGLTENQLRLLQAFDIPFRLRRIRAVVSAINSEYGKADAELRNNLDDAKAALANTVLEYEAVLDDPGTDRMWIEAIADLTAGATLKQVLKTLSTEDGVREILRDHQGALAAAFDVNSARFAEIAKNENQRTVDAILLIPKPARRRVASALVAFPFQDVLLYPLMDTAGISDLIKIETLRISPYDARIVGDRHKPLESAGFGAFRGFLDRSLREIDLVYGRLNGAERIVEIIVNTAARNPASPAMNTIKKDFTLQAMQIILDEARAVENTGIIEDLDKLAEKLEAQKTQPAGGLIV